MNKVILKQSGELADHRDQLMTDALTVLASRLVLDRDLTLRGFARMLRSYPDLQRLSTFAPTLSALGLSESDSGNTAGLDRLEFSRVVEIIGTPTPPRLEVYHILRGCAGNEDDLEIRGWPTEALMDVPIRMGALRHVVFGDNVHSFRFETVCTLFDFIDGIIWQLAFHGAPRECALRR